MVDGRQLSLGERRSANSVEISRSQTCNDLGLGCVKRLETGEAGHSGNGRSSFRNVLVHAPGVHRAPAA